ncbi:MAG: 4-hydroxy-tetrahydrodipicolinate synthase [Candidatus Hadarchaeales archaeon]
MFEGVLTAMVTPFLENGELNEEGLKKNVEFQIRSGIDGLVPVGTTGECSTLSYEEHLRVVEIVVEAAGGRVPVIAGTGSNSTREALMLTREAKERGADGALVVVPYYNRPTQEGLYQHFKRLAEEVDIPQILYNIPSRTGVNLAPETVAKLAKLKNVVGIKEASGNFDQISKIIELTKGEDFMVTSGNDSHTLPMMALGAVGVISVASNLVPSQMVRMVRAFREGRVEDARRIHYELSPLFEALFLETNPCPVKEAMEMVGLPAGPPRLPLVRVGEGTRKRLREVLSGLGLLK